MLFGLKSGLSFSSSSGAQGTDRAGHAGAVIRALPVRVLLIARRRCLLVAAFDPVAGRVERRAQVGGGPGPPGAAAEPVRDGTSEVGPAHRPPPPAAQSPALA